jgi:hypothetical protein
MNPFVSLTIVLCIGGGILTWWLWQVWAHRNDPSEQYTFTTPVVATDLPPGGKVVVSIFRPEVTFIDGSKELTLSTEDFVNDVAHLDFLFPEGMDGGHYHHLNVYDSNGKFLGRR